jgi:ATP-dependent DNA helicase RecG
VGRTITVADSYTAEEFAQLISRETDRLELKTGAGAKPLQEAMVAFSNTDGGVIFLGVDDRRQVQGRQLDQGTDDRIHEAAVSAHGIGRYRVREIEVGGRPVVAVQVWRREEGLAQTSDGRVLVRRGARNQPMIGEDLWHLMSSRALRRFERAGSGVLRSRIDDGDLRQLCTAYGWPSAEPGLDDRLRERGLLVDDELTIAGALVLTDPSQTLGTRKFVIEIRLYDDAGSTYRRREVIGGPLPDQVEEAAQFINAEVGSDLVVVGVHRYELARLPAPVVREAVANAVSHRSYELDQSAVVVEIRPHQVTVTSPGRLPDSVTIETMRQAQAARNPVIIDVLRRFGLTEDAGRGVDVMQDLMREEMLDPPVFEGAGP